MKRLEEYVSKHTFEKLQLVGINNWERLFKIHWSQENEFWATFSKVIADSERKKIEKVLYRECVWDRNKYYFHNNECLSDDGTYSPRSKQNSFFELVKFERVETRGNLTSIEYNNNFYEGNTVIDRINRTIIKVVKFTDGREIKVESKLNYYLLNKFFERIRIDATEERFTNGFIESVRYCTYKLTYADGEVETYNLWISNYQNKLLDVINKYTVVPLD